MSRVADRPETRHWADVLALLAGVSLVGFSLWPSIATTSPQGARAVGSPGGLILLRIAIGLLAVGAVVIAQRWNRRGLSRAILLIGGVVLLVAALLLIRDHDRWETWSIVLPAVALMVSAWAVGPMPRHVHED